MTKAIKPHEWVLLVVALGFIAHGLYGLLTQ